MVLSGSIVSSPEVCVVKEGVRSGNPVLKMGETLKPR
jgi:hypothetical protein